MWVWVDPAFSVGELAYEWYGYNSEGYYCEVDSQARPLCSEETNNIFSYYDFGQVYMPLILAEGW